MGAAILVAIFAPLFVAFFFLLIMSGEQWRAAQDRARARRMAEHRMNARLLNSTFDAFLKARLSVLERVCSYPKKRAQG